MQGEYVLVTGGCGFVGRTIVRALTEAGARVRVADLTPPSAHPAVDSVVGDLHDPRIQAAAVTPEVTGIIHLAARTSVLESVADPAGVHAANVTITAGLLDLARRAGVSRFLLASTNAVVGDVGETRIHEDIPLRPLTPYGATKAACEMLLAGYAGSYSMTTCAVRLTNIYGPGMAHKDSFVPRLMRAARDGEGVSVYGDGSQRRDLVHVEDVARGFLTAWASRFTGSVIVGSGRSVTVNELVEAARRATGRLIPVDHVPAKQGEMPAVVVDISRALSLGYRPRLGLEEGLAGVWKEFAGSAAEAGTAGGEQ
ncbi:NAD-dependent epimerase/dehydratase family protein [Streptomyces sp. RB6PN25]|uniref:NAD-dependent epimerase/dehydratase family protein n=1 Tax=Streptomyces humicola TaxID=2953240 RepID=A0ABT1PPF6_9ACTN|nr:NAD-dependent epimerase/dehydratase family protein [Streptomyces humicola]MCQ4079554.1 NAD-dependent epimerase/dehydratase family protein [Streptomyces humicola]